VRFWLSRSSGIPLREQLATQIVLGVLSKDLRPGTRLASTRELGRRLGLHPNTVSAVYRDLEGRGWLESRRGSGVYVPARDAARLVDSRIETDRLISQFFQSARDLGIPLRELRSRLAEWLDLQPPDHFLVIEHDAQLRHILAWEIHEATGFPVEEMDPASGRKEGLLEGAQPVVLFNKAARLKALLPPQVPCILIQSRSIASVLEGRLPIRPDAVLAVASRWPEFVRWTRTVLASVGVSEDALVDVDLREREFPRGLDRDVAVICDALAAQSIPRDRKVHVFRLISDASLQDLRRFAASLPGRREKG